ncbi:MAG: ABC transporter ATP-binding protein [Thermodesulfobacteriota bacterium]
MSLLKVSGLTKSFGGLKAVNSVNLQVDPGEIVGLIGPNGAGKTTVLRLLTGFFKPEKGQILFNGQEIAGLPPDRAAKLGIIRTFQETTVYPQLPVFLNITIGTYLQTKIGVIESLLNTKNYREKETEGNHSVDEIIKLLRLTGVVQEPAMNLPHGYQRRLGIAIALACGPKLLLLDEPFSGMNPEEVRLLIEDLKIIHKQGVALILVEHQMKAVMNLCDRVVVLNFGEKIAEGTPEEVVNNEKVVEAYLGGMHNAGN